jgi:rhodanese-related sulfurtransferase
MNVITTEELRDKLECGDDVQLVMALPAYAFRAKRIPGSRHFETIDEALRALGPDDEIVLYCGTVYCPGSIYAYRLLERKGYRHLSRYAGGIAEWEAAGYSLEIGPPADSGAKRSGTRPARRGAVRRWPAFD